MNGKGICYIVCAGERTELRFRPTADDFVIAADGGYGYLEDAGIKPDLVIGDFDSLGFVPEGNVIVLDPIKDMTDSFAAADEGLKRGYGVFEIYSALGGRLSHTFANLRLLSYLSHSGARAKIIGNGTEMLVTDGEETFTEGGYLSVFPVTETAEVKITDCKYSGTFVFTGFDSLGTSNEPLAGAKIEVLKGEVAVITEK